MWNLQQRNFEKIIIDGKVTLMDDEGKSLKNINYLDDHDSEDEVESVDNVMPHFLASERAANDYGPVSFRFFHHWLELDGFSKFVVDTWNIAPVDVSNGMRNMVDKMRYLKL
ncbi:hypothetical protein Tco_1423055, partial [Tanacetum coccineum]